MKNLSIKNLTIKYDDLLVLHNFTAEFDAGIHWIQGFNGSGKSSLLKSLCGINPVNKDVVHIMGHDLSSHALQAKSQVSFVPDKPEVYPFMTGYEFLKLIAKIKNVKLTDELFAWMEAIKLCQFKHVPFSQMSFGTRRKFTLCSVLIGNPQVILLDEPFNGLDKNTIHHFKLWLQKAKSKSCILVVSHDTELLKELHDSITLIEPPQ